MLNNGQESNRLAQWSRVLSAYCITYESRKVENGHAIASLLADFLVEDISYKEQEVTKVQMVVASLSEEVEK